MRAAVLGLALLAGACGGGDGGEGSNPSDAGPVDAALDGAGGAAADAAPDVTVDGAVQDAASVDGSAFAPGPKQILSADNPDDLDEDPSVVSAQDGSLVVAYFSQRNANPDIYVKRSVDGVSWTEARVTVSPSADYFPSLSQDESGRFHLTWFRWTAFGVGSIWYTSTLDPLSWDAGAEEQVTTDANVDDWVPTLAHSASGDALIAFASEKRNPAAHSEIFLSRKPKGATAWLDPVAIPELQSTSQDDTLPTIARTDGGLSLLWVRCDPGGSAPCLSGSADLFRSTSADGTTWSPPIQLTSDSVDSTADTLPSLYQDHSAAWWVVWISAPSGTSGQVLEAPLGDLGAAVPRPELTGYSAHVAATTSPGVFIGVWVESDPNQADHKDVVYRLFSK